MRKTPENDFMRQVMEYATLTGWKIAHFGASVRVVGKDRRFVGDKDATGFPDLVMARGQRLIFAELKAPTGKLSEAQIEWLAALALTKWAEVYVWKPKDWPEIETILGKITS